MNNQIVGLLLLLIFVILVIGMFTFVIVTVVKRIRNARNPKQAQLKSANRDNQILPNQVSSHQILNISAERNPYLAHTKAVILFLLAILLIIFGGSVAGIAAATIGSLFYVALIFPLVLGFVGGVILTAAIQWATIRNTFLFIFMACLTAISIYGIYHYGRYVALQVQASIEIHSNFTEATKEKNLKVAKALVDYSLEEETGYSGFPGYMLFRAKEGVSLGRFYSSSRINLGPILSWLYWALEFGIILWLTITIGRKEILIPVCNACGSPYGKEKHLGGVVDQKETMLLNLIKQKAFAEVGNIIEENAAVPSVELYLQSCERCGEGKSYLFVRRASRNTSGRLVFAEVLKTTLQPADRKLLLDQSTLINT